MAAAGPASSQNYSQLPFLSSDQQSLLLAALSSNKRSRSNPASLPSQDLGALQQSYQPATSKPSTERTNTIEPSMFSSSLTGSIDPRGSLDATSYAEFNAELDFDFSGVANDNGDDYGEVGEKRKNSDASDEEESGNKRREGDDKKKPGRKPITSEPTTKRKAQNRAAQRAFRDRKEKHLKDLEQKVTDLEKSSESANHENGLLRAQVERLQVELHDYRKRMSSQSNGLSASPPSNEFSSYMSQNNIGRNDFNFDFPKFGTTSVKQPAVTAPIPKLNMGRTLSSGTQSDAPSSLNRYNSSNTSPRTSISSAQNSRTIQTSVTPPSESMPVDGMFSPEFLSLLDNSDGGFSMEGFYKTNSPTSLTTDNNMHREAKNKFDQKTTQSTTGSASSSASPPDSNAQDQATSSCATSPEPFKGYDSNKLDFLPAGIASLSSAKTPTNDYTSFDWLTSQNGGQFDPVLFGDYRDSQDAIVGGNGGAFSSGLFEDSFANFNNTFPFTTDTPPSQPAAYGVPATTAAPPKETACSKLMNQVNMCAAGLTNDPPQLIVPGEEQMKVGSAEDEANKYLTAHKIWSTLQTCPKFQSGDLDIEGLCTQLTAKAKCSDYGHGLVVPKEEVEAALWRLAGVDDAGKVMGTE